MPPIIHLSQTTSTNDSLSELVRREKPENGSIVYTDFQTSGRGQAGSGWESEKGKNLLFSIVFYPENVSIQQNFILSQMVAVAIADVLKTLLPSESVSIKWANDIYVGEKKIVGILIENIIQGARVSTSIAGIGLNVNQLLFRSNAPNPVSLRQLTGKTFDLVELLNKLQHSLLKQFALLQQNRTAITTNYIHNLFRREGYHNYADENGTFKAKFHNILPDGQLILETKEGEKKYFFFKELQFLFDK
ncbi:MAG: biotin--[acetyl-CoA-carboxylase] ligase [Prevotellaceae bacterium]|jgi:BirA family biotin operon repressor/biotin-[acetyl-CoA-carboxylase] ligase|nr:biotin--[acetyl-CoA-carboxylase] ligase [Prevotellaceae bacterium]